VPPETWIATFPSITAAGDKLPGADPDNDGVKNMVGFVLNGNPSTSDSSTLPTLSASGANFVFSFNRRDDSEGDPSVMFQYRSDLTTWTTAGIGAVGSVVGDATIVVAENAEGADAITVTVPKSVALNGKLFGRLTVSE
jgi:hypothetical protein